MQAELQIINKILQDKDYGIVERNGLDASNFEGYSKEFQFIEDHFKKFGQVPDTFTFNCEFQDFDFIEVNESEEYLIDKLYEENAFYKF